MSNVGTGGGNNKRTAPARAPGDGHGTQPARSVRSHAEAALPDVFVRRPDCNAILPTVSMETDQRNRMLTGAYVS